MAGSSTNYPNSLKSGLELTIDFQSGGQLDFQSGGQLDFQSGRQLDFQSGRQLDFQSVGQLDFQPGGQLAELLTSRLLFPNLSQSSRIIQDLFIKNQ